MIGSTSMDIMNTSCIIISSYHHIIKSSYHHIIISSYHHIIISSYRHIVISSYHIIISNIIISIIADNINNGNISRCLPDFWSWHQVTMASSWAKAVSQVHIRHLERRWAAFGCFWAASKMVLVSGHDAPRTHPKTLINLIKLTFSENPNFWKDSRRQMDFPSLLQDWAGSHKGHWNDMQDVHGFGSEIKKMIKTWGTIGPANWLFLVPYPHRGYILIQSTKTWQAMRAQTDWNSIEWYFGLKTGTTFNVFCTTFCHLPTPLHLKCTRILYGAAVLSGEHCWVGRVFPRLHRSTAGCWTSAWSVSLWPKRWA